MKTMLDLFKEKLIEGMTILKVKECHTKYVITIGYDGDSSVIDLWKTCQPGYENKVCETAVITAMSNIYFNRGDLVKTREWLDKLYVNGGSLNND